MSCRANNSATVFYAKNEMDAFFFLTIRINTYYLKAEEMINATDFQRNDTKIVPYHNRELKKGLEKAILKQAGIEEE